MADETVTQPTTATGGEPGTPNAQTVEGAGEGTAPQSGTETTPNEETLTLTQSALDKIIADRLARQKAQFDATQKKAADEAQRKAQEEQGQYKALYDGLKADYDALQLQVQKAEREALCAKVAAKHRLPDDLALRLMGETEEELTADAERIAKHLAPPTAPNLNMPNGTPRNGKPDTLKTEVEHLRSSGQLAGF